MRTQNKIYKEPLYEKKETPRKTKLHPHAKDNQPIDIMLTQFLDFILNIESTFYEYVSHLAEILPTNLFKTKIKVKLLYQIAAPYGILNKNNSTLSLPSTEGSVARQWIHFILLIILYILI